LASILGTTLIEINSVAEEVSPPQRRRGRGRELMVDTSLLRAELLKRDLTGAVVSGHLLPEVLGKREVEFVAVLRCEPLKLKKRLLSRGYGNDKVIENVEAELIGVVLDAAVRAFGEARVHEYDTTHATPHAVAEQIAKDYGSGAPQGRPWIDWTLGYDSSTKLRLLLLSAAESTGPAST